MNLLQIYYLVVDDPEIAFRSKSRGVRDPSLPVPISGEESLEHWSFVWWLRKFIASLQHLSLLNWLAILEGNLIKADNSSRDAVEVGSSNTESSRDNLESLQLQSRPFFIRLSWKYQKQPNRRTHLSRPSTANLARRIIYIQTLQFFVLIIMACLNFGYGAVVASFWIQWTLA